MLMNFKIIPANGLVYVQIKNSMLNYCHTHPLFILLWHHLLTGGQHVPRI